MPSSTFGVAEAARRLGISPSAVRKATDQGRLSFQKNERGHRVFSEDDLQSWCNSTPGNVAQTEVESTSIPSLAMVTADLGIPSPLGGPHAGMEHELDSTSTPPAGIHGVGAVSVREAIRPGGTTPATASYMEARNVGGAVAASTFAKFRLGLKTVDVVIEDSLAPSVAEELFVAFNRLEAQRVVLSDDWLNLEAILGPMETADLHKRVAALAQSRDSLRQIEFTCAECGGVVSVDRLVFTAMLSQGALDGWVHDECLA